MQFYLWRQKTTNYINYLKYTVHVSAFRDPITLASMCNCTKKAMSLQYATKQLIYRLKQEVEVWKWRE